VPPRAFFTPQHALSPVWAPSGSGSRAPPADASAQRYAEEAHPIFREIYKAFPDPERVWAAYTDLMQRPLDGSSVEESTASAEARMRLLPLHLSLVLRAITPNVHSRRVVARRDKRRRRDEVSAAARRLSAGRPVDHDAAIQFDPSRRHDSPVSHASHDTF
jgi:hypothetical protein